MHRNRAVKVMDLPYYLNGMLRRASEGAAGAWCKLGTEAIVADLESAIADAVTGDALLKYRNRPVSDAKTFCIGVSPRSSCNRCRDQMSVVEDVVETPASCLVAVPIHVSSPCSMIQG